MAFLDKHVTRRALLHALPALAGFPAAVNAGPKTNLRVLVEDEEGEPISRASIVIGRIKKESSTKMKGRPLQLKTSLEGSAPLPPLQQGWYLVQVIITGYQTWGGKVELNELEQELTITMQAPRKQFSVHEKKPK